MNLRRSVLLLAALCLVAGPVAGQYVPRSPQEQLAGLVEDVAQLQRQMGQLRIEMEGMRRENEELRRSVDKGLQDLQVAQAGLEGYRAEMDALSRKQRAEISRDLSKQIDTLAEQTQKAINVLAKAIQAKPQAAPAATAAAAPKYSDDYPKEGVPYTVKPGDTLARIAKEHGATVADIRNANKIEAKDLKAGQVIFVPQRK